MAVVAECAHRTWTGQARIHLTKPHFQSNLYPWNWCNFYYCLYLADLQSSSLKLVQFSATIVCIMLLSGMCRLPCCGIFVVVVLGTSLGISLGIGDWGRQLLFHLNTKGKWFPFYYVFYCVFFISNNSFSNSSSSYLQQLTGYCICCLLLVVSSVWYKIQTSGNLLILNTGHNQCGKGSLRFNDCVGWIEFNPIKVLEPSLLEDNFYVYWALGGRC